MRKYPWKDDVHGLRVVPEEIKLYHTSGHTIGMKLSQIARMDSYVSIMAFGFSVEALEGIINKRPERLDIILHSSLQPHAKLWAKEYPTISIRTSSGPLRNLILIEPETVYCDIERGGEHIGIRDRRIFDHFHDHVFMSEWRRAQEVCPQCPASTS